MVTCLELLPSVLITGDSEGDLCLWSLDDFTKLRKLKTTSHGKSIISIQTSGTRILSGSCHEIKEWDLNSGELVKEVIDSQAVWQVGYARGRIAAALVQEGNLVLKVSFSYKLESFALQLTLHFLM